MQSENKCAFLVNLELFYVILTHFSLREPKLRTEHTLSNSSQAVWFIFDKGNAEDII